MRALILRRNLAMSRRVPLTGPGRAADRAAPLTAPRR
jgi:hypothetical protein